MDYAIWPLSALSEEQAIQAFDMFAEGFYFIFSPISKNKQKLRELFMQSFDRDMAWVCLCDERPVGFIACGDSRRQPVNMEKEACLHVLGKLKGFLVWRLAGSMLGKPKVTDAREGWLDYLTTDPAFRGRGVASRMIRHACETLPFERFSFEVLSKNENAIRLYEKLGMQRVKVKNDPAASLVGHGKPIVMTFTPQVFLRAHNFISQ